VEIRLACVGKANTCPRTGKPLARDLFFSTATFRPLAARVTTLYDTAADALVPGCDVRQAYFWLCDRRRGELHDVYDTRGGRVVVRPFAYALGPAAAARVAALLELDDEALLRAASTSPEDERGDFPAVQRATMSWILEHPTSADVFAGPRAGGLCYAWHEGKWRCEER